MKQRLILLASLAASLTFPAQAVEPESGLPPFAAVARVLRAAPAVQAAASELAAETARRRHLEAGDYEWNLRLGGQQRRAAVPGGPQERFNEWNAAIERPLRLPGKAALDAELGTAGVELAETALGDALHEAGRDLLQAWFAWQKAGAIAAQWAAQVDLLAQQAKTVARRQQLGDAARLESIQAEAGLAQAQAQLAQARVRQESTAEMLRRRYPGLPLDLPAAIPEPVPLEGSAAEWVAAVLEHSHELGLARGESRRTRLAASRAGQDRLPDPTVGLQVARERGGEDRIVGAYLSIPLPGPGRRAVASAALAQSAAAGHREAAVLQKVATEAAALHQAASAAYAVWSSTRKAADRLGQAATMTARAYELGEGSLTDLLAARRFANETELAARLARLEALESRYRLLLDAHRLWLLDEERHAGD